MDFFVSVRDGASVLGTDFDNTFSSGASFEVFAFVILSRVRKIHRRVLVKGRFRLVMLFSVSVRFWISLALRGGERCWRVI